MDTFKKAMEGIDQSFTLLNKSLQTAIEAVNDGFAVEAGSYVDIAESSVKIIALLAGVIDAQGGLE